MHRIVRESVPRGSLVLAVALAWIEAVGLTVAVIALGRGIDLLAVASPASVVPVSPGHGDPVSVVPALAGGIAVAILAGALSTMRSAGSQAGAERRLRSSLVAAVFRGGPVASADRAGELLALALGGVERAARYRAAFIGPILGSFTTPLVVLAVVAIALDPVIAACLVVMALVVPVVIGVAQRAVRGAGGANRRERARLTAAFLRSVQGLSTLVGARAADRAARELAEQGERQRRTLMRTLARNQLLILVIDASVSLGVVLVAVVGAALSLTAGRLSLGGALAVVLCSLLVIRPVDAVGSFFYIGIAGRAAEQAIGGVLARDDRARKAASAPTDPKTTEGETSIGHADAGHAAGAEAPAVELDGVTAGWNADRPVVRDLSLRVEPGEHVALVGPSGVGKSTVSALVQAFLLPERGSVRVGGVASSASTAPAVRRRLAVVEQRTFLFHGTIADNLRLARADADEAAMRRALAAAGLDHDVDAMPLGLDTPVGEHGLRLSGGQSQRLAIARAILHDAPVLLLDEPTSQVDLAGEAAFLDALERLASERTVLMIAHRPGAILAADRVVRLEPQEAREGTEERR